MKITSKRLPWLILVFGAIATIWLAWTIQKRVEIEARKVFDEHALYFKSSVQRRLSSYEDILFGMSGLYHTDSSVSHQEFRQYAESLNLGERAPAIDVLNYAEYFRSNERDDFIRKFREETPPDAKNIIPLALLGDRAEYMVTTRVFPPGEPALGVNLLSNRWRYSDKLSLAYTSALFRPHEPVSSGLPIRPPGKSYTGLALRLGVFKPDGTGRQRFAGSVGIGLNVHTFFRGALPESLRRSTIYRVENIGRVGTHLYHSPIPVFSSELIEGTPLPIQKNPANVYVTSFVLPFGGALLRFEMAEAKAGTARLYDTMLPYAILLSGTLIFGMAAALTRKVQLYNAQLKREIEAQTARLRQEVARGRQLEQELTQTAEQERLRVAHELHDELGQRLTGISLTAKALGDALRVSTPELSGHAGMLENDTSAAIASVRGLAHGLMPVPPGKHGLRDALEQLAASTSSRAVRCVFDFDDPVDIEDKDVATNLYRIAQEAVNNAVRHAGATCITITLDYEDGKIALSISDDGNGFAAGDGDEDKAGKAVQNTGAGLRIMAHRASAIHFELTVTSTIGRGTIIKAKEC